MKYLFVTALALASAAFTDASSSLRANNQRELQATFPAWNQQCRDDAGPPFIDDSEIFGTNKYHTGKPAFAVGDCPDPLKEACATKPKTEAFLEGPINCGGKGWFCRIHEEPGWPNIMLNSDVNFGYCNTTEGTEDPGWDRSGHCHGSDSDDTFYWWVRDHWHRQYVSPSSLFQVLAVLMAYMDLCTHFFLSIPLYRTKERTPSMLLWLGRCQCGNYC